MFLCVSVSPTFPVNRVQVFINRLILGVDVCLTNERFQFANSGRSGMERIAQLMKGVQIVRINESYTLTGAKGSTVSLLPLGEARGISVRGCYYTIEDFTLASDTSRGVSNVVTADEAVFTVREGDLMLFHYSDIHGHGESA